jgi:hypothetical protein
MGKEREMARNAWIAFVAAAAGGLATTTAASAQQMVCGERQHLIRHLGDAYSEAPSNLGLAATGSVVEILTSERGTWTILVTEPTGVTCVLAAGENWENLPRVAMGPGA